jgi:hypothetical protein
LKEKKGALRGEERRGERREEGEEQRAEALPFPRLFVGFVSSPAARISILVERDRLST